MTSLSRADIPTSEEAGFIENFPAPKIGHFGGSMSENVARREVARSELRLVTVAALRLNDVCFIWLLGKSINACGSNG
jgi:hypothetical protein